MYSVQFHFSHSDSFNSNTSCRQRPSCQTEIEPNSWYECMHTTTSCVCTCRSQSNSVRPVATCGSCCARACSHLFFSFEWLWWSCRIKIHHEVYFILPLCKAAAISWCQQVLPMNEQWDPLDTKTSVVSPPLWATPADQTTCSIWTFLTDRQLLVVCKSNRCRTWAYFYCHIAHSQYMFECICQKKKKSFGYYFYCFWHAMVSIPPRSLQPLVMEW